MIRLYLLCCLVLVGSNIAVSVDIHVAATKHKRQNCDVNGTVQDCFTQIINVQLYAENSTSNSTEFRIRSNTVATITCTEPCFTAFQSYFACQGNIEALQALNQYWCVQYEGTYCEPLVQVGVLEGTLMQPTTCGNYTFDVCPDECATVTRNNLASLGCCGREILRGGYFLSTETAELCGIDVDLLCSGSARLTASIFGAVSHWFIAVVVSADFYEHSNKKIVILHYCLAVILTISDV